MESMENLNTTPEEEDVEKKMAEDLGIDPITGETPLDREMDAQFNQTEEAENPEEDLKEAA